MDKLTEQLQSLATQLGVTVEYLWPYLVRWTFANHLSLLIFNSIASIVFAILTYISSKLLRSGWGKQMSSNDGDAPSFEFFQVAGGFIGMVAFCIVAMACFSQAGQHIAGVLVPEAQAIIDIIEKVNGSVKK